ncbi:MAG: 30S ribosomal protein S21 [Spirochaetales bacterium]|nr:30S ribosomal protein S21 [Spirochaetales bacterium]
MAYVIVNTEEELEKAIKRFKRQVEKEGIIREWKKREYYEKPSKIRSRRRQALKRKQMKKQRRGGISKGF